MRSNVYYVDEKSPKESIYLVLQISYSSLKEQTVYLFPCAFVITIWLNNFIT